MHNEDERTITLWEALQYFGNKKKPTRNDKILHTLIELSLLALVFLFIPLFVAIPLARAFNLGFTGIGIIWALTITLMHFAGKGIKVHSR